MMWSDGLTLLHADSIMDNGALKRQTIIMGSVFEDNSDVDFVTGGARYAQIEGNQVIHSSQPSFAGIMLDNFDNSQPGDYTGATLTQNRVQCSGCTYGINLGPHGWYMSKNIIGGNVTGNHIEGAIFLLNVDGAGTQQNPISVYDNTFGPQNSVNKCGHMSTQFVVCPQSVVRPMGSPTLQVCLDGCH